MHVSEATSQIFKLESEAIDTNLSPTIDMDKETTAFLEKNKQCFKLY